jgi:hypothetical protein
MISGNDASTGQIHPNLQSCRQPHAAIGTGMAAHSVEQGTYTLSQQGLHCTTMIVPIISNNDDAMIEK